MNNTKDIKGRISEILSHPSVKENIVALENLEEELELLEPKKSLILHLGSTATIGEIQLTAKVVKAILTDDPYKNNLHLTHCPIPIEIEGDWHKLEAYINLYKNYRFFYLEVPSWGILRYRLQRNQQLSSIETNLYLNIAQQTMRKMDQESAVYDIAEADSLINSFIFINSAISNFFYYWACSQNIFEWKAKYSPCFFDRQRLLDFRGLMMGELFLDIDGNKLSLCKKYFMRDFLMQTKFLTFWVSLLDVATFPGLCKTHQTVYYNLVNFFLKNFANIYIYDIIAESNPVSNGKESTSRGSSSNTTRLKIFFTTNNDQPQLLRLDLPHIDHPYVHINWETNMSKHIRISDDAEEGQYDNLFDPLIDTLGIVV